MQLYLSVSTFSVIYELYYRPVLHLSEPFAQNLMKSRF